MISVIIPAYIPTKMHHSLFLRALHSLENQTFKEFEVICVLNGCYTSYEEIIDSTKNNNLHIRFFELNGKASGAIARNLGVKQSNYELIAQLDVDDQYDSFKLEKQYKFFTSQPEYDFVGTLAADFHPNGQINDSCFAPGQYQEHEQIAAALKHENVMCHSSVMFKKTSFLKLGGYNVTNKPGDIWPEYGTRMWEDWDLWKRAVKNGMKMYNLTERLYYWSIGTGVER